MNRMKTKQTIIEHPSQLNALSAFSFSRRRGRGKIQLSQSFQHPERGQLEAAINKNYYACGCSTSARYLIAGLVIGGLALGVDTYLLQDSWIQWPMTIVLATTFGGAILGKLVGLANANAKLKRSIHTVQAFWRPQTERPVREQPLCG